MRKALVILTKQILWSGEGKILIGIDLREMGGKAGENIETVLRNFLQMSRRMVLLLEEGTRVLTILFFFPSGGNNKVCLKMNGNDPGKSKKRIQVKG